MTMPRSEEVDKARFDLLKRAYIDARYSEHYRITEGELAVLRAQVRDLAERVRLACGELLGQFCGAEAAAELGELPQPPEAGQESALPPPPDWEDVEAVERWSLAVMEEGEARGREAERLSIARSLLAKGMTAVEVAEVTGLTPAAVAEIKAR